MKLKFAFLTLLICALFPLGVQAAALKLCSSQEGLLTAKSKCKSTEKVVNLPSILDSTLQSITLVPGPVGIAGDAGSAGKQGPIGISGTIGPIGPQGKKGLTNIIAGPRGSLDFSACHRVVSGPVFSAAQVTLTVNCDSQNEFLFEDEWSFTGGPAFVQSLSRNTSLGNNNELMPYGFQITANLASGTDFTLIVKALCCPR